MLLCSLCNFFFADASANNTALFGPGSGPINGTNLRCTAEEDYIVQCVADLDVTGCTHANDAGVTCTRDCKISIVLATIV